MDEIKEDKLYSNWFIYNNTEDGNTKDLWHTISNQIYTPSEMYDKYSFANIIQSMHNNGILWTDADKFMNQHRFRRPIDELDFWTFEYDITNEVWRPYHLNVTRHFPDVYILTDPAQEIPSTNRIFKSFFFYSDTMNVLDQNEDIIRATSSWDIDMQEYEYDKGAIYRDIFMEKFYWMGIKSIYKGITETNSRWEVLEYVIDNPSYERFNQLFLNTMDPYFKMGLATFLKSSNYEFPFDDAVDKMNEAINQQFVGYKRITNFETYLNKTWIPSYFDYVTKIMDDWDPGDRLLHRPRSSFDVLRLLPLLLDVENNISIAVGTVSKTLSWILEKLKEESYNLNIENIETIQSKTEEMLNNIITVYKFTKDLDLDIYSIEDLNYIISKLQYHMKLTDELEQLFSNSRQDIQNNNVYENKKNNLLEITNTNLDTLYNYIINIGGMVQNFDMETFMKSINDLTSYFEYNKVNPSDTSLIGYINKFNTPWSINIKELRNKLFQSTSIMYGKFEPTKAYTNDEVIEFVSLVKNVQNDLISFIDAISKFWNDMGYSKDEIIIDKFDNVTELLDKLISNLSTYMNSREELLSNTNLILNILSDILKYNISDKEKDIYNNLYDNINNIILSL